MKNYLENLDIKTGQHIIVHSSFRKIHSAFPEVMIHEVIELIKDIITPSGSIVMPAFTYNYKLKYGTSDIFNRETSKVKVGSVAEEFRKLDGVTRTSSPTHSFSIWGKISEEIDESNSPESPLGKGSVLDWLAKQKNSYALLLGVNFSSLSFIHYIENMTPVPWKDFSPWDYLYVENAGVSSKGIQQLKEIPGCSKSFINFENYLLEKSLISPFIDNELKSYFIPIKLLLNEGMEYFKNNPQSLLCPESICRACDARRQHYPQHVQNN